MHLFGPDLSERNRQPEWMDEPGLDPELHRAALVGLRRVNAISRTVNHIWRAITRELKKPVDHPLVVGDLACGGGDIAIELAQLAHQAGWPVRVIGYDLSEQALRFARKRAEETALDVSFKSRDLLGAELPAGIDVFYSSLFMHHLSNEDAGRLLASAGRQARQLVVISDLVRSGWGYGLAWWGGRLLSRSPLVHKDGPLSVRAAFRPDELQALAEQAGLHGAKIRTCFPARLLLTWRKAPSAPTVEAKPDV